MNQIAVDAIQTWTNIVGVITFVAGILTSILLLYRANKTADKQVREIGIIIGRTETWADKIERHSDAIGTNAASLARLEVRQQQTAEQVERIEDKLDEATIRSSKAHEALSEKIVELGASLGPRFAEHVAQCAIERGEDEGADAK